MGTERRSMTSNSHGALLVAIVVALAAGPLAGCGEQTGPRAAAKGGEAGAIRTTGEAGAADGDAAYRAEIEEWREKRLAGLTSEEGWLSLVGLYWLEARENPCGSDPTARVQLPAPAPARVGTFAVAGGRVAFRAAPGVDGLGVAGEDGVEPLPSGGLDLAADTADGGPTVLTLGGLRFYLIDRDGRLGVRVKDRDSPARREFAGLDYFPLDPGWRLEARFEPYDPPKPIPVPNVLGTVSEEPSPGAVVFDRDGETYRLDAIAEPGASQLFLIFGDRTNARETYGGGRFLFAAVPGDDGRVVVDFNRSYNPPCAFTEFATCPLPPRENKLPIAIAAGERRYAHSAH